MSLTLYTGLRTSSLELEGNHCFSPIDMEWTNHDIFLCLKSVPLPTLTHSYPLTHYIREGGTNGRKSLRKDQAGQIPQNKWLEGLMIIIIPFKFLQLSPKHGL